MAAVMQPQRRRQHGLEADRAIFRFRKWQALGVDVLRVMRGLADEGMTMIVVTHEIGFAREVADRVLFLDGGRLVEQGPASEVLNRPQNPRTQDFLQRVLHPL